MAQQSSFGREPSTESVQASVGRDHAVAGNHDGQRIRTDGLSDRTRRRRIETEPIREVTVPEGGAKADLHQLGPDGTSKVRGSGKIDGDGELLEQSLEIVAEFEHGTLQMPGCRPRGQGFVGPGKIGTPRENDPSNPVPGGPDRQTPDGGPSQRVREDFSRGGQRFPG